MFVARKEDGSITGCWTVRQWDGQEELAEQNEIAAILYALAVAVRPQIR